MPCNFVWTILYTAVDKSFWLFYLRSAYWLGENHLGSLRTFALTLVWVPSDFKIRVAWLSACITSYWVNFWAKTGSESWVSRCWFAIHSPLFCFLTAVSHQLSCSCCCCGHHWQNCWPMTISLLHFVLLRFYSYFFDWDLGLKFSLSLFVV